MNSEFSKKVKEGFVWESLSKLFTQIVAWVSTVLVARLLSPDDYGIVGISGIFTGLALLLSGLGLSSALINRDKVDDKMLSAAFFLLITFSVFLYALLYVLAPALSSLYGVEQLTSVIRVSGVIVLIASLRVIPSVMLMRELKFRLSASAAMLSNLTLTVSSLSFAYMGMGLWSLIFASVLSQFVLLFVYLFSVDWRFTVNFSLASLSSSVRYGLTVLAGSLFTYGNQQLPRLFIGGFFSTATMGFYQLAVTLADIPINKIGQIFERVVFPAVSRLKSDPSKSRSLFLNLHFFLVLITLPVFVGIAVTAEQLVVVILGPKWVSVSFPLQIICLINVVRISVRLILRVLEGVGDAGASMRLQFSMSILQILFLSISVNFGFEALMIGWLASFIVLVVPFARTTLFKLQVKGSDFWSGIRTPILASLSIVFVLTILPDDLFMSPLIAFISDVVVGVLVYVLVLIVFGRPDLSKALKLAKKGVEN